MVYMPLLEETGHRPTEKYAHAPEILAHCRRIGRQFGLYGNALFHTKVENLGWDEANSRWVIETNRGDRFTASFIGLGTGPLHVAKLPGIPGIETFSGHSFHTSRWDYEYTGGGPDSALLDRLADKRVAIIGTGATAIQCVPHLARACQALHVFQRTPSSVDVRANAPIDPDWFSSIARPVATALAGKLHRQFCGRLGDGRLGSGRLDRSFATDPLQDEANAARRTDAADGVGGIRRFRFRKDGGNSRADRRHRDASRNSAETQGLVSAALQAAVLPR
jgi:cation diffusion facilitator CzcD-associated flavoprotein CzcO